jgi:hypothetical protein
VSSWKHESAMLYVSCRSLQVCIEGRQQLRMPKNWRSLASNYTTPEGFCDARCVSPFACLGLIITEQEQTGLPRRSWGETPSSSPRSFTWGPVTLHHQRSSVCRWNHVTEWPRAEKCPCQVFNETADGLRLLKARFPGLCGESQAP